MTLIPDKTLLRLGIHISFMRYLEDRALCFTEIIEYDNISFNCEVVKDENDKEDGKEAVTNSEEETSKIRLRRKVKRDTALVLLLATVPGLFTPISAFILILGSSACNVVVMGPIDHGLHVI